MLNTVKYLFFKVDVRSKGIHEILRKKWAQSNYWMNVTYYYHHLINPNVNCVSRIKFTWSWVMTLMHYWIWTVKFYLCFPHLSKWDWSRVLTCLVLALSLSHLSIRVLKSILVRFLHFSRHWNRITKDLTIPDGKTQFNHQNHLGLVFWAEVDLSHFFIFSRLLVY